MPKADYIQQNEDAFSAQLQTFKTNIVNYSAVLGLSAGQVAAQAGDAAYYEYLLKCLRSMQGASLQWIAWRELTRAGGTPPASGAPVLPALPAAVAAVAPGVEVRFRALCQLIKANANYNAAMGKALSIEGAEHTGPDLTTIQPQISALISGNHVNVIWGWGGHRAYLDICELQVDRADGKGFNLLAYDTTPNYTDTQPFPAAPMKWTYRAIYRVGDNQVGQWSQLASIVVGEI